VGVDVGGLRGLGVAASLSAETLAELAGEAERLGYSSFWVNDLPHADGLTALAEAAAATTRIGLGVGVVPLDQRSPDTIAATIVATGLPRDRLVLGVGAGGSHDALARVRAGVEALRGAAANVVVGALGPRMAALGGQVGDGVLLNWLTPEHAERSREWVGRGSVRGYVRCGFLPGAAGRLRQELARYDGLPQFERHLERMGAGAADTCVLRHGAAALQAGIAPYEEVLDETIVRTVTPDDELDTLLALVRACAP
jgi:alkanesulfonate monooxygenase SsuD/methylene tetrahydromethanopterin reductase-like flavin-dependent oxidoreductase (luciferase family)